MGWEDVKEEEVPIEVDELCEEAQLALVLFNTLPDKIEGMAGVWLGKDYAGLGDLMDIYEIEERGTVLYFLQIIIRHYSKYYSEQRKQAENRAETKARVKKVNG